MLHVWNFMPVALLRHEWCRSCCKYWINMLLARSCCSKRIVWVQRASFHSVLATEASKKTPSENGGLVLADGLVTIFTSWQYMMQNTWKNHVQTTLTRVTFYVSTGSTMIISIIGMGFSSLKMSVSVKLKSAGTVFAEDGRVVREPLDSCLQAKRATLFK